MIIFPFDDEPNTEAIVCTHILEFDAPILYASRDEDGEWEFLCSRQGHSASQAMYVSLYSVFCSDPSIGELKDMPCGSFAERASKNDPWVIQKGV